MATKSVIEIELIDEQFKAFGAQLQAIQAIIGSMPNQWKEVNKAVNEEQKAEKKLADEAEKARKKRLQEEKDFNRVIEDRKKAFMDAAYFTGNIAKNLASGALSIAKWTAFAAIGGGFGLGGLAASASDYRKRSQGLGTTTAGLRAAETNLGQYVDVNSVLGNITNLQHDITQQYKLTRLGGGKGDSVAQLQTVMTKAIQDFKAHGQDLNYAKAVGLTDIFSPEDLIRLSKLPADELAKTFKRLESDIKSFELTDATSRRWQEFWQQLGRAGQSIQVLLLDKLDDLSEPLTQLSDTIIKVIKDFLDTHDIKEWITDFGKSIKDFGKYLNSPEFNHDVESFMTNLKELSDFMLDLISYLPTKSANIRGSAEAVKGNWYEASKTMGVKSFVSAGANALTFGLVGTSAQQAYLKDLEKKYGLPSGLLDSVWLAESSRGKNMLSPAGAMGHFGFMPKTAEEYNLKNPNDFLTSGDAAARKLQHLIKYYRNDIEKGLAAYNLGEGKLNAEISNHSNDWKQYLESDHPETFKYLQKIKYSKPNEVTNNFPYGITPHVMVTINNTTDTNVAVKGLTNK